MDREMMKLYAFMFFKNLGFLDGVLTIFFLKNGLDFFQISILFTTTFISISVFEIPAGVVADKISRRYCILFGEISLMLFLISIIWIRSFIWFLVWSVVGGLSYSLSSGAIVSMVYDNLKYKGLEENFKKIQSNYKAISEIAMLLGGVIGGFVATISFSFAIILSVVSYLIAVTFLITFREYPFKSSTKDKEVSMITHVKRIIKFIKTDKRTIRLIFIFIYENVLLATTFPYIQAYIYFLKSPIYMVAMLSSLINVSIIVGYYISGRMGKKLNIISIVWVLSGIMIFVGLYHTWVSLLFIFFAQIMNGTFVILWQNEFQKMAPSEKRASITSFAYTGVTSSLVVFYIIYGYIIDRIGLYNAILGATLFLLVPLLIFTILSINAGQSSCEF